MAALHVRKGDFVSVRAGRDRGKTGRVLEVMPREGLAVVEKLGVVKRHSRPTEKNPQGGVITKERPFPVSLLTVVCMACRRPTRLKRVRQPSGEKIRVCRHCQQPLDQAA